MRLMGIKQKKLNHLETQMNDTFLLVLFSEVLESSMYKAKIDAKKAN